MTTLPSPTLSPRAPHFARSLAAALCLSAFAALLTACQSHPSADLSAPVYPDDKAQASTLDIQVVRDETRIRLTNTTARAFGKSRLWINRWFSRDIESFEVGQTLDFDLSDFRDQYSEPFRAGGFFATKNPERLVLAQLETADSLVGLIVVAHSED